MPSHRRVHAAPALVLSLLTTTALADVATDGTLGRRVNLSGDRISIGQELGATRGGNLFHSFDRFDVGRGDTVTFEGPASLDNIVARVTGGRRSEIDGRIASTAANADLWLLNPAGILFGSRATLDLQGDFHASTAGELRFADGSIFSASDPTASILTTATPRAFGFLSAGAQPIVLDGPNLQLRPNRQMTLAAGDLDIAGDGFAETIRIEGGRLVLAAVDSAGELEPGAGPVRQEGSIRIGREADIDLAGNGGGKLVLSGGEVEATSGSRIELRNLGDQDAGLAFAARLDRLRIEDGVRIEAGTQAAGRGGDIDVQADSILISGAEALDGGLFSSSTFGPGSEGYLGDGGRIRIATADLSLISGGNIAAYGGFLAGNAGSIEIEAENVIFDGANSYALTGISVDSGLFGGQGGSVAIEAETIEVSRGARISAANGGFLDGGSIRIDAGLLIVGGETADRNSGIFSSSLSGGGGGLIEVETENLRILANGLVATDALDFGDAGDIRIRAATIELDGGGGGEATTAITSRSVELASGNGGSIDIVADQLTIVDGARVAASSRLPGDQVPPAFGGNAGTVRIEAGEALIDGAGREGTTGIFSDIANKSGNAGRITIDGEKLEIVDGGRVSSTTIFGGDAGSIAVDVDELRIDGRGVALTGIATNSLLFAGMGGDIEIVAKTVDIESGGGVNSNTGSFYDAGSIDLNAPRILIDGKGLGLFTGISTAAQGGAFGNAGRISIATETLELQDGAQISSDTLGFGNGGAVEVAAETLSIRGGERPSSISSQASEFSLGDAGTITIDTDILELADGGLVRSSSFGSGAAGNISLDTRRIDFSNATVRTEGRSSQGGRIRVRATELVSVRDVEITTNGILAEDGASIIQLDAPLLALNRSRIFSLIEGIELTPEAIALLEEIRSGEANLAGGTSVVSIDTIVAATTNTDVTGVLNDIDGTLQLSPPSLSRSRELLNSSCQARAIGAESSLILDSERGALFDPSATLGSTELRRTAYFDC